MPRIRTRPPTLPDEALLDALKNEVRSRALTAALKKLEAKREDWWQHWRKAPVERSSKFRQNYLEQDKSQKIPTLARHRPVYEALPPSQTFRSLTKLNRLARDAAEQIDGDRLHLDTLFDDPSPKGMNRYHGAFCLHLSFSIEFASVISALSEFVEYALVGVLVEHS